MKDEFGGRMKGYESAPLKNQYDGRLPLYMRLDGRSFSKLTKKLGVQKPRDQKLQACFDRAIEAAIDEFGFIFGFNQSDEVSLFFPIIDAPETQLVFNGKAQKLLSVIPSFFTSVFSEQLRKHFDYTVPISFDARLVEFPSKEEATNMLVWRWQDARRNYITDSVRQKYSEKQVAGISTAGRLKLLGDDVRLRMCATFYYKTKVVFGDVDDPTVRSILINDNIDLSLLTFEQRVNMIYEIVEGKEYTSGSVL